MNNPMCADLEQARLNRERVKEGYCNAFYDKQANILAQWSFGSKPPSSLILGGLPQVNPNQIRLDNDPSLGV